MTPRPLKNSEKALAATECPNPAPGRGDPTLIELLLDLGLPPENVHLAEALLLQDKLKFSGELIRRVILKLPPRATIASLQRAMLGADGRTLARDAAAAGADRSNLARGERRLRKALQKLGPQAAQ